MALPWQAVRRDERGLTWSLALPYFLIIAAFTLGKIARDTFFLVELPAAYLPYVYIGMAALAAVTTGALGKLGPASAKHRLSLVLALTGFSLLLFALWFRTAGKVPAVAFYLWSGVYGLTLVAEFWLLANDRIDSRQARRLFGPIGAAGVAGGLVAALAATAIAALIPTLVFLVAAAALYFLAAVLVRRIREQPEDEEAAPAEAPAAGAAGGGGLLRDGYVRLLCLVFLVGGVTTGVVDYAFKVVLQGEVADGGEIASVLGAFYSVQGLVSIVAQVGLTGAVFSRFGHRPAANALPAGVLGGGLLALLLPAAGAPWAVLGTRLYDSTMRFSMSRTAWEFLYFPLGDEIKARAKRLVDVVVNRSADAAAGVLLLAVNFALGGSRRQLAALIVVLAVGWLALELRLNRAYPREVERSLRRLVPERAEEPVLLAQVAGGTDLVALLDHPDEQRVLSAMGILERLDRQAVLARAPGLARHTSAAVRARLLAIVAGDGRDPNRFGLWAARTDRELASVSVEAASLPETADRRVAIAAAAGEPESAATYRERLDELLDDANQDVRRTAFRSVALSRDRSRLPKLIDRLTVPRDREAVREALVLFGKRIAGTLGDYLVDPNVPLGVRQTLISVLAEMGGPEAVHSLYRASRLGGDRRVVDGALLALLSLQRRQPEIGLPEELILEDLRQEVERNGHRLMQLRAVREAADAQTRGFLDRVLRERLDQSFRRIFHRLALADPSGRALAAYRGLRSGRRRVRAQAIEYLDTRLPGDLKRVLLPLIEAPDDAERERVAAALFGSEPLTLEATLDQLLRSREPWLQACGIYAVGMAKIGIQRNRALELSRSHDPVVRDMASWAARRLA